MLLGFYANSQVEPATTSSSGNTELCLMVNEERDVDDIFARCNQHGVDILLTPHKTHYGYTFLGQCPQGHRLRIAKMLH